jgi:hypothetical protein
VADLPRQEFQIDLADFGESTVPRYGFVAIDIFSKKAACFPTNTKLAADAVEALQKTFVELGYPASIMCDEGGEFQGVFAAKCKEEDITLLYSRTGGRFVERFIRTLKMALFERRKALGGSWAQYVQPVLDQYNERTHTSIGAAPNYIAENEYDMDILQRAYATQMKKAKPFWHHPTIAVGDKVKIRTKPPSAGYKETFNSWSSEVYVVERLDEDEPGGVRYYLQGYRRPLLRFEIKKIEDVHRQVNGELKSVAAELTVQPPAPPVPPPPPPAGMRLVNGVLVAIGNPRQNAAHDRMAAAAATRAEGAAARPAVPLQHPAGVRLVNGSLVAIGNAQQNAAHDRALAQARVRAERAAQADGF